MKYTYLIVDIAVVAIPLAASFHRKILFYRHWRVFLPCLAVVALFFLAWDVWFTQKGNWGFNRRYVSGLWILGLPLEEVLFFFCIPYACIFTSFCLKRFFRPAKGSRVTSLVTWIVIGLSFIAGVFNYARPYTFIACLMLSLLLGICRLYFGRDGLKECYIALLVLLPAFLLVDGLLTGTGLHEPVVWYSAGAISGYRIATIPIEDVPYGMELIMLNILLCHSYSRVLCATFHKS
jgi:lycopene cyclase domain-containing protein